MTTAPIDNPTDEASIPSQQFAWPVNLILPGGGLVLIGQPLLGCGIAIAFGTLLSISLGTYLLFPDEISPVWRGLLFGIALGTYAGGQIRFAQNLRTAREHAAAAARKRVLAGVRDALARSDADQAWTLLQELRDRADFDLLVAFRFAQVLTVRGDTSAAAAAWRRLRHLDRHRIYGDWIRAFDAHGTTGNRDEWRSARVPRRQV